MQSERVLAAVVEAWVAKELPGDTSAAARAGAIAQSAYENGASVSDACRQAAAFVGSWCRHPSHSEVRDDGPVALAS